MHEGSILEEQKFLSYVCRETMKKFSTKILKTGINPYVIPPQNVLKEIFCLEKNGLLEERICRKSKLCFTKTFCMFCHEKEKRTFSNPISLKNVGFEKKRKTIKT
jgi:hypothetical protein